MVYPCGCIVLREMDGDGVRWLAGARAAWAGLDPIRPLGLGKKSLIVSELELSHRRPTKIWQV